MVRHIDYLIDKLGEDHVGLGSDFDGCTVANPIKDVTGVPKLVRRLWPIKGYGKRHCSPSSRREQLAQPARPHAEGLATQSLAAA